MRLEYLTKIPAFLLLILAQRYAFHPPTTTPSKEALEKFGRSDFITRVASWFPTLGDVINFSCFMSELIGVIAHEYPSPLASRLIPILYKDPSAIGRLAITPSFILGFLLMGIGAAIRKTCYDTLGRFFTFQLAIFKDHKLVTTGPYAVVRHPSYTAFLMANTGLLLLEFGPGSYVWESGVLQTAWKAVLCGVWAVIVLSFHLSVLRRIPKEDRVLKKEFGQEWEAWARNTPYKLIPYVY
ncbi:ICMT-domain-containing protein [Fomes fomentarius]|nr:ICMT-domain-containing protein [Fomes fomentarius]